MPPGQPQPLADHALSGPGTGRLLRHPRPLQPGAAHRWDAGDRRYSSSRRPLRDPSARRTRRLPGTLPLRTPFNRSPEPLSLGALQVLHAALPGDPVADLFYFIETERTGRVYDQLHRYCKGEQDGVSILVAGTRGAGKTTLVRLVVQHLIVDGEGLIPLPILIHG